MLTHANLLSQVRVQRMGAVPCLLRAVASLQCCPLLLLIAAWLPATSSRPATNCACACPPGLPPQLANLQYFLSPQPGEHALSLLPPWHIYERTVT